MGGGSAPPTPLPPGKPSSPPHPKRGQSMTLGHGHRPPPPTHKTPPVKPTPKMWTENLRVEDAGGATTNPYSPRVLGNKAAPNRGSTARKKEKRNTAPLEKRKAIKKERTHASVKNDVNLTPEGASQSQMPFPETVSPQEKKKKDSKQMASQRIHDYRKTHGKPQNPKHAEDSAQNPPPTRLTTTS